LDAFAYGLLDAFGPPVEQRTDDAEAAARNIAELLLCVGKQYVKGW
jgi:hypothetical protein